MTSKEFLKSKLFDLSAEYPATSIKYYFDTFDNDHFVCINPNSDLNTIIEKEALDLDRFFIRNFPSESLSFIKTDHNLQFDELVYEYIPSPIIDVKTINFSRIRKSYSAHYSESTEYNQPLYLVRKINKEEIVIEKEEDEFAFAA